MTIHCRLCDWPIKSLHPDLSAQSQVMKSMAEHLVKCHEKEARNLARDMVTLQMVITTYLMLKHYVRIPAEEGAMLQAFEENEQALINLFEPQVAD